MKMKEKYHDTDLREALRRKYADTPQLPADFMNNMMKRMEQQKPVARTRGLWQWITAAACLLFVAGVGLTLMPTDEQAAPDAQIAQHTKTVSPTKAPSSSNKQNSHPKKASPKSEASGLNRQDKPARQQQPPKERPVKKAERVPVIIKDPHLHYAACTETEDTVVCQAPSRVDEFIAKLANYNNVEGVPLRCTSDKGADSTIVSTAYLFEGKKELDLFSRLLQVACWYDTKTPGYLLNYSHKQFVFCLQDLHKGQKYLWIAERIGSDYILLFSTHSPIDTNVSSACFQEYREQLTHKGINMLNF